MVLKFYLGINSDTLLLNIIMAKWEKEYAIWTQYIPYITVILPLN